MGHLSVSHHNSHVAARAVHRERLVVRKQTPPVAAFHQAFHVPLARTHPKVIVTPLRLAATGASVVIRDMSVVLGLVAMTHRNRHAACVENCRTS